MLLLPVCPRPCWWEPQNSQFSTECHSSVAWDLPAVFCCQWKVGALALSAQNMLVRPSAEAASQSWPTMGQTGTETCWRFPLFTLSPADCNELPALSLALVSHLFIRIANFTSFTHHSTQAFITDSFKCPVSRTSRGILLSAEINS